MYRNLDPEFEGVAFYQNFEGATQIVKKSLEMMTKSWSVMARMNAQQLNEHDFEGLMSQHVCISAKHHKVNNYGGCAHLLLQLCDETYWETDIYDFNEFIESGALNSTAVIRLMATHGDIEGHGLMNSMLYLVESFAYRNGKREILTSVPTSNVSAIKCLLNNGYVIRGFDRHPSAVKIVLYKHIEWSFGVSYHLNAYHNGGCFDNMADKNSISNIIKDNDHCLQVEVNNMQQLAKVLQSGYYPCDIINGHYQCYRVKGLPTRNTVKVKEYTNVS
jgi:hypothetical protein